MYDDRRQHPRFPILLVAMAHTSTASFEVVCTNVSAGGAFLATRNALETGAPVELELKPHGPDGPTVLLTARARYAVPRGAGAQPGFSVTWSEAACPTSRLALEQVLRDILRVPRFRVLADGLGGRFHFGAAFSDDDPEPPARVVFPPAGPEPEADAQTDAAPASHDDDWSSAFAEPAHAAVLVRAAPADATPIPSAVAQYDDAGAEEAEAPRAEYEAYGDFADMAIGDAPAQETWDAADHDAPPPSAAAFAPAAETPEAETIELSVALAAALARELAEPEPPVGEVGDAYDLPATSFDDPAFDWAEFETADALSAEAAAEAQHASDDAQTVEVSVARLMALDPTLQAFPPEPATTQYEPRAAWDSDDVGFAEPAALPQGALPDDDYFPETLPPEPEPAQRITRSSVIRRLSGGVDTGRAVAPQAPRALNTREPQRIPTEPQRIPTEPQRITGETTAAYADVEAFTAALKPSQARPTSSLARSFLAKVATGEHAVSAQQTARNAPTDPQTATSTYAEHDVAAHRAAVSRQTDDLHAAEVYQMRSRPAMPPPVAAEARPSKPMEMVDAGQEVPRVMTESTVAYTRESAAIGPLLHAQTWPIEGEWPAMIPPSLAERYGHLEHIGTGGNGVAYRAVDLHLNRTVVLKFLAQSSLSTELARKYFLREVKLAASLNHPNIVHIYDIGKVDDVLYYAMEYVDGVPLSAYLPVREPMRDWQFLYSVMAQLCDALDHAHSQQILHRDIKPDNVLVGADGVVKLFDFGLARVADEGFGEQSVLIGTPHYMAPEQLMGGRVDHRTDIYAVGVMLFRLVTGVLPFQDGNIFAAHAVEPVPDPRMFNPALPVAIVPVIEKAMAKQPAQRYSSSRELAIDLYSALFT